MWWGSARRRVSSFGTTCDNTHKRPSVRPREGGACSVRACVRTSEKCAAAPGIASPMNARAACAERNGPLARRAWIATWQRETTTTTTTFL